MIAKALRAWVAETGPQSQSIAPGSPWENGCCASVNGKLRDECLGQEIFYALQEPQKFSGGPIRRDPRASLRGGTRPCAARPELPVMPA